MKALSIFAIVCLAVASQAQQKLQLQYKAEAGRESRVSSEMTVKFNVEGNDVTLISKQVDKTTYKTVGADGSITFESVTESQEQTMNGEKLPDPEEKPTSDTITIKPSGELVSYISQDEPEDKAINVRLFFASRVLFDSKPVGVGDKWTKEFAANKDLGSEAAKATYELIAFEDVDGVKCAKIKFTYSETSAKPAISCTSTSWVEISSGDEVKSEITIDNVDFGPGPNGPIAASMKGTSKRSSGGPLAGQSGEKQAEPPKEKGIDDVVKGATKQEGVFNVYRKKEAGRETIWMEIPESKIGKNFLLQATASSGTSDRIVAGMPINDFVIRFDLLGEEKVQIIRPNFGYRADLNLPIAQAVQRSFAESLLDSISVEVHDKKAKSYLINVTDTFRGDLAQISSILSGANNPLAALMGGPVGSYGIDRVNTYVKEFKTYPDNLMIQTVYNFVGGTGMPPNAFAQTTSADGRSIIAKITYNLWEMKDTGYVPRYADGRIGYFTVDHQDFSNDRAINQTKRLILRWDLRKKDPAAPLSEPVKPIVFYLDNAIPADLREAVRTAILNWNPVFEKIGIKNAIQVLDIPKGENFDIGDMRHNFVQWVTSPNDAYAVANFRFNPITGEIVNASITVDSNMVKFEGALQKEVLVDPLHKNPKVDFDPFRCHIVDEGALMRNFGFAAVKLLGGRVDPIEYARQEVLATVQHEFGHILGLRHNFIASTQLSLAQMGDKSLVEKYNTAASVMDYIPFNVSAIKKQGVPFWGANPGLYDQWAIEYGYKPLGATKPQDESRQLAAIASRSNEVGHTFQTDERADGWDPKVARFDSSSNPIEYWKKMTETSRYLAKSLGSRLPKKGESFYEFTRTFSMLIRVNMGSILPALSYVGGLNTNNNYKGDKGEKAPLVPVPAAEQRAALQFVTQALFAADAFNYPKEYFRYFTPDPDGDEKTAGVQGQDTNAVRDEFAQIQSLGLSILLAPDTLSRVMNNEYKAKYGEDLLTAMELFQTIRSSVWSELRTGDPIQALRRDLQRTHLEILVNLALSSSSNGDVRMLAWNDLKTLKGLLGRYRAKSKDAYTTMHLADVATRIQRALDARQTVGFSTQTEMGVSIGL